MRMVNVKKYIIALSCALTLGLHAGAASAQESSELTEAQSSLFWGSKEDPAAKKLLGVNEKFEGRSYLAGDEWNLHLYYPSIKGIGGGYVGVGSDQGYMMISWSRPKVAWMIDYDPLVIETHKIYRTFFLAADTPKAFLDFWKKSNKAAALAALEKDWKDDPNYPLLKRVYKEWRAKIHRRHTRIRRILKKNKVPSYLSDQEHYTYVRDMIRGKRLRTMVANLLDDEGLIGIGEASRKMGIPIRVFYTSNAEEYWKYPKQFRDNVAGLNFDDASYVLHTLSTWSTNRDYRYVLQKGLNYQQWVAKPWVKKIYNMVPRRKLKGADDIDYIVFKRDVEAVEARRAKRKKRKKKK